MDLNNYKVIHSHDVMFFENQFPGKVNQGQRTEPPAMFLQDDEKSKREENKQVEEIQEARDLSEDDDFQESSEQLNEARIHSAGMQGAMPEQRRSNRK